MTEDRDPNRPPENPAREGDEARESPDHDSFQTDADQTEAHQLDADQTDAQSVAPESSPSPHGQPLDVDAAFADIVARWEPSPEQSSTDQSGPDQSSPESATTGAPAEAPVVIPVWRGDTGGSVADLLLDPPDSGSGEDEPGFHPPRPAPLPPPSDRLFWIALVGLVGGPLFLMVLAIVQPGWGTWSTATGVGLTIAGFAALVFRQPAQRDDDPSQGARV